MSTVRECTIVTAPASDALPESLSILKTALRVEHSSDDAFLTQLLQEAAEQVTERTGRQVLTATRLLKLCDWWNGALVVPFPKLQSVTNLAYYDAASVLQTLDSSNYTVITSGLYGRIILDPILYELSSEIDLPVLITFTCGYGTTPSTVPNGLKTPIREIVRFWYENDDGNRFTVARRFPQHVDALLDPWKLTRFG